MTKKTIYGVIGILILVILVFAGYKFFDNKKQNSKNIGPADELKSDGIVLDKAEVLPSDIIVTEKDSEGFLPAEITVKVHGRVVWVNDSSNYIWPASNPHPTHEIYPEFDAKEPLEIGKSWGFVFDRVGDWGYHDHLKPNKRGVVHVTE